MRETKQFIIIIRLRNWLDMHIASDYACETLAAQSEPNVHTHTLDWQPRQVAIYSIFVFICKHHEKYLWLSFIIVQCAFFFWNCIDYFPLAQHQIVACRIERTAFSIRLIHFILILLLRFVGFQCDSNFNWETKSGETMYVIASKNEALSNNNKNRRRLPRYSLTGLESKNGHVERLIWVTIQDSVSFIATPKQDEEKHEYKQIDRND